jgi:hypothetical protein
VILRLSVLAIGSFNSVGFLTHMSTTDYKGVSKPGGGYTVKLNEKVSVNEVPYSLNITVTS